MDPLKRMAPLLTIRACDMVMSFESAPGDEFAGSPRCATEARVLGDGEEGDTAVHDFQLLGKPSMTAAHLTMR
jgi:hypothetical protein